MTTAVESGAQGVRWDLTPLAPSEEAMKERLEAAVADAAAFVERWSAKSLETIEPTSLRALLRELADIRAARFEARQWAFMLTKTDSENPAVLDIRAWVDNRSPRLDDAIRHFELAWMALPDDRARSLAEDEAVARDRHYLLGVRRFRPFMLSPAEERVLSARDASAGTAWQTLRDRTLGSLSARFDDGSGEREWPLSELESARRAHPDRDVRRRAQETTTALFEPALPVIAHCYDSLVADRLAVDDLRGHDDPMDQTNLENEIDAGVVEALLAASEAHVEIAHRWFRRKAALLGLERLDAVDLQAAAVEERLLPWDEARRLVVDMFGGVTPALGTEAERFFSENRIDAEPRRGKPSMAFCVWPSTRVPGFVCLNWTGQLRDLVILTHELGHGTNWGLAAQRADGQLAQAGHRPRGGPVDVRRTASGRAPPLDRRGSGPRAARTGARPGGHGRVHVRGVRAFRAGRVRSSRRGPSPDRGPAERSLRSRGGEGLGRRGDRRARQRQALVGVAAALRPRALLHTTPTPSRSCSPPGWWPARASPASRSATSVSSRPAARRRPRSCWPSSVSTSATRRSGTTGSRSWRVSSSVCAREGAVRERLLPAPSHTGVSHSSDRACQTRAKRPG